MIIKETLQSILNQYLPEPHASLASGMLVGTDLSASRYFIEQTRRAGLIHIVVVSGSNITMLAQCIEALTHTFDKRLSRMITIASIICYVLIVGVDPPTMRAGLMGVISLMALYWGRQTISMYLLCMSAVIMLIINPEWMNSISFQLSFSASLGIIIFSKFMPKTISGNYLKKLFLQDFFVTVSAQIFTIPIIFYHFKTLSIVSFLANALAGFVIAPIMIMGMLILVSHAILPHVASFIAFLTFGIINYLLLIIEFSARVPYGYFEFAK